MKILVIILILFSHIVFSSCSDENCITSCNTERSEIELIAEELQNLINEQNITVAHVYFFDNSNNSWISEGGCNDFEVTSPFIKVCGTYYRLENLVKFEHDVSLDLFFRY